MRRLVGSEEDLSFMVARYMQLKHPTVLYHFDFGSGTKLTMGQAVKNKRLNKRSWPDLFIAKQAILPFSNLDLKGTYNGLFIELKKDGTKIYLKDGRTLVASEHIRAQASTLESLRMAGYMAEFVIGFDECTKLIDDYLS